MTAWPESSKVWSYSVKYRSQEAFSVFTALDMTWSVYPEPTNFVTFCQQTNLCTLTHSVRTNIRGGAFIGLITNILIVLYQSADMMTKAHQD